MAEIEQIMWKCSIILLVVSFQRAFDDIVHWNIDGCNLLYGLQRSKLMETQNVLMTNVSWLLWYWISFIFYLITLSLKIWNGIIGNWSIIHSLLIWFNWGINFWRNTSKELEREEKMLLKMYTMCVIVIYTHCEDNRILFVCKGWAPKNRVQRI